MTAVVSYNFPLGFFSGKWSAVGAKTDLICTCLSFGRCVVPKTNRYFYTFALWNMKRSKLKLLTSRLPLRWISLTSSSLLLQSSCRAFFVARIGHIWSGSGKKSIINASLFIFRKYKFSKIDSSFYFLRKLVGYKNSPTFSM